MSSKSIILALYVLVTLILSLSAVLIFNSDATANRNAESTTKLAHIRLISRGFIECPGD